jgi:hypothetical protein
MVMGAGADLRPGRAGTIIKVLTAIFLLVVAALGPSLTFNRKIAGQAIGLNARYYNESKGINRLDGQSFFPTLSLGI